MNTSVILRSLSLSAMVCFCLTALAQDRPDPNRLRRDARALVEKARDLKASGDTDGAERLSRAAKDLTREADNLEPRSNNDGSTERRDDSERRVAPRSEDRELGRSDRSGGADSERRGNMDNGLAPQEDRGARNDGMRLQRPGPRRGMAGPDRFQDEGRPFPPRERLDGRGRPGPDEMDLALRRYHIRKAIRHLHAAGLHAQADRLEERLDQAIRRLHERRDDGRREP